MATGMEQFLQVFFEETDEHLATLELLLIGLDLDQPDAETLNGIFRAAHSIKGSSGMFGFDDLTAVTHELETLLDRIRCGQTALHVDMIGAFLEARDVLQRLLDAHRSQQPDPDVPVATTVERLPPMTASACSTLLPQRLKTTPATTPSVSSTMPRAHPTPAKPAPAARMISAFSTMLPAPRMPGPSSPTASSTRRPARPRPPRPSRRQGSSPRPRLPQPPSRLRAPTANPARSASASRRSTA